MYNTLCMAISLFAVQRLPKMRKAHKNMKKLLEQIIRFGIVGFFCFFIDFGITTGLTNLLGVHYLISKFL